MEKTSVADLGHVLATISNGMVRIHREAYGRGADRVRTIMQGNYVASFLDGIYTPVERTLIDAGDTETVRRTRLAFQRAVRPQFVAVVEEATGRKVLAFMSQVHFDPDVGVEAFVLESRDDPRDGNSVDAAAT